MTECEATINLLDSNNFAARREKMHRENQLQLFSGTITIPSVYNHLLYHSVKRQNINIHSYIEVVKL